MRRVFGLACWVFVSVHCGSLLNELERIRAASESTAPAPQTLNAPSVLYTIPADGTVSASVQTFVDIVYDQPIDASSATGAGNNGACTGTIVASFNEFTNCGGVASVSGNTVRLSANPMPKAVPIKIRASGIRGTNGLTGVDYQSATGFSFASPCGQNCFYSDSAPLTGNTLAGSSNFYVSAGTNAGKQIIIHGGSTQTTLYDPFTNQTAAGPALAGGMNPNLGSHSFVIPSGAQSGHVMVFQGNGTNVSNRYDMSTSAFVAGPTTGTNVGAGATSFLVTGGSYSGLVMTAVGGSLASTITYNNAGAFVGGGPSVGSLLGAGTHGYRLDSGPQVGQFRILMGGNVTAKYYNDATDTWSVGVDSNCNSNLPSSFRVSQGSQAGKFYQICGGGNGTNLYDQNVTSGPGSALTLGANPGSITIPLTNNGVTDKAMVFQANNSAVTMIYSSSTDSFALGPNANTGMGPNGSSFFPIQSGPNAGRYFIAMGGSRTTMYDPATGKFSGTRPFAPLGIGGNYFNIKTGQHAGKVLIVAAGGNSPPPTTIYDPQTAEMIAGPDLAGGITAGAGSHNFTLTSGPNSGKVMLINAQNSMNTQFYDPNTNSFSTSGATGLSVNVGNGANTFYLSSGAQAGKFMLLQGNAGTNTFIYDPAANTFTIAFGVCNVNNGALTFTIPPDGLFAGHQFIVCGGTATYRINPAGPSGIPGAALPAAGNAGSGSSAIYLKNGVHAGKFLIIHAGGTSSTTLYQPSIDTMTAGPSTIACTNIGVGSVSFEITAGINKGKFLITLGALTPQTCLYDPVTNTFAFGPNLGPHPGYGTNDGTVAFPTGGGIYPTAYVIVHGGFFGTFSHYFQY